MAEESFISNVDWFCFGCGDGRRFAEQRRQHQSPTSASSTSAMELMQSAVKKVRTLNYLNLGAKNGENLLFCEIKSLFLTR